MPSSVRIQSLQNRIMNEIVFFFFFVSTAVAEVFSEASKLSDFLFKESLLFSDYGMFAAGHTSHSHSFSVSVDVDFVNMLISTHYILCIIGICDFEVIDTSSSRYANIVI